MTENLPKVIGPEEPGDQGHLGPAMRALTPMQQAWVHATVQSGLDATKAAAAAGYTGDRKTLKSTGWKLAHDERVQEALREEASKLIRSHSVMAVSVMAEIAPRPSY
jgi:phage terminase small subunit